MEAVGRVIEESTPHSFLFKVDIDRPISLHDYVFVEVNEVREGKVEKVKVLAEVLEFTSKSPFATEELASGRQDRSYSYRILRAEILGYINEKGVMIRPKVAPDPNSQVYPAEDEFLQTYFKGNDDLLPITVGKLMNRHKVTVPVHLQNWQFHAGIFASTRAGKSYLAGRFMEEILHTTIFPVIVIDVHGDYVKMNQAKNGEKHSNFDVVVYYPPNAPHIAGVTAEEKSLDISPSQLSFEAFIELTGATVGELQSIALRNTLRDFQKRGSPFGLADVLNSFQSKLDETDDEGKQVLRGESRGRYQSIVDRLKDLEKDVSLPPVGMNIADLFQPKTLSVICLSGLRARIQDAYCSVIIELILNHLLKNKDKEDFMPVFLFIEEAHRVASVGSGARYSVGTISTAIREGAKFGLFLTLISQRPRSIDPDILSNVGNYAVLRITNAQDQQMIENASESFSHRLVEDLPSLNQGEAILVGPFVPLAAHITTLERKTVHYGVTPNLKKLMDSITKRLEKREKGKW